MSADERKRWSAKRGEFVEKKFDSCTRYVVSSKKWKRSLKRKRSKAKVVKCSMTFWVHWIQEGEFLA